jgi:hypothetical protein
MFDPSTWQGKAAILVNGAISLALVLYCRRKDVKDGFMQPWPKDSARILWRRFVAWWHS